MVIMIAAMTMVVMIAMKTVVAIVTRLMTTTMIYIKLTVVRNHLYILKEKSNLPGSIFPFKFYFDKPNDMYNRTT